MACFQFQVEDTLKDLIDGQTNPTIATYAKTGEVHIRVTASGEDTKAAGKAIKPVVKELKSRFGADIYSTKAETTLEMAVADLLMANDLTVTTAESCTGSQEFPFCLIGISHQSGLVALRYPGDIDDPCRDHAAGTGFRGCHRQIIGHQQICYRHLQVLQGRTGDLFQ